MNTAVRLGCLSQRGADAEITAAEGSEEAAEQAWLRERQLLTGIAHEPAAVARRDVF